MEANILFVDDIKQNVTICCKAIRKSLLKLMNDEDIHIYEGYSFFDGKNIFDSKQLDLVITDRMMPGDKLFGNGGDELVAYIKNEKKSKVKVIIVSAKMDFETFKEMSDYRAKYHGEVDYIIRANGPFTDSERLSEEVLRFYQNYAPVKTNLFYKDLILDSNALVLKTGANEIDINDRQASFIAELICAINDGRRFASFESLYNAVFEDKYDKCDDNCYNRISKVKQEVNEIFERLETPVKLKNKRNGGYYLA